MGIVPALLLKRVQRLEDQWQAPPEGDDTPERFRDWPKDPVAFMGEVTQILQDACHMTADEVTQMLCTILPSVDESDGRGAAAEGSG
jgi:hypothetical protein